MASTIPQQRFACICLQYAKSDWVGMLPQRKATITRIEKNATGMGAWISDVFFPRKQDPLTGASASFQTATQAAGKRSDPEKTQLASTFC
jgi:hypothetical protein